MIYHYYSKSILSTFNAIGDMSLPQLQVCLTTWCVKKKQKYFSDFIFVIVHFYEYSPALLLMRICHFPFFTPLIIILAVPVAVMVEGFLWVMGFVSALWSWQWQGLVYACWSALIPNHHAKSQSCFFTIGKETFCRVQISYWAASNTQSVWDTASLRVSYLSPLPPTPGRLNCEAKISLVCLSFVGLSSEITSLEREGSKEAKRKQFQLSSCLASHENPQGLSSCSLSLLPTSLDSCFLSKETGSIDELQFTSTLSFQDMNVLGDLVLEPDHLDIYSWLPSSVMQLIGQEATVSPTIWIFDLFIGLLAPSFNIW